MEAWTHKFVVPFLPPTGNHIYVTNWRRKTRFLSKDAQTFKTRMGTCITQGYLAEISTLKRDAIYALWYVFYFSKDALINKGFATGKAISRYKKMDVENRVKLVSDSFATAIGIDDCQFFHGGHSKMSADLVGGQEQIHIFLREANSTECGL